MLCYVMLYCIMLCCVLNVVVFFHSMKWNDIQRIQNTRCFWSIRNLNDFFSWYFSAWYFTFSFFYLLNENQINNKLNESFVFNYNYEGWLMVFPIDFSWSKGFDLKVLNFYLQIYQFFNEKSYFRAKIIFIM